MRGGAALRVQVLEPEGGRLPWLWAPAACRREACFSQQLARSATPLLLPPLPLLGAATTSPSTAAATSQAEEAKEEAGEEESEAGEEDADGEGEQGCESADEAKLLLEALAAADPDVHAKVASRSAFCAIM